MKAEISKVVISRFEYKFSDKKYKVSVVYKSGVIVSYTRDSYEKLPFTVKSFVATNKKSERNFFKSEQDVCSISSFVYAVAPDDEPETEEATSEVTAPVEENEKSDDVPKTTSSEMSNVPFDMRIKNLCRKCKHLESCFNNDRSKVIEDIYFPEPCDDICGECTLCCPDYVPYSSSKHFIEDSEPNDDFPF